MAKQTDKLFEPEKIRLAIKDGVLEDDIYWAGQMLSIPEKDMPKYAHLAPTPLAFALVDHGRTNRREFMSQMLPKAMNRKKREVQLRDDGRKHLERLDQAYTKYLEEHDIKRECPKCGCDLGRVAILPPGSERPDPKPQLPKVPTGPGS